MKNILAKSKIFIAGVLVGAVTMASVPVLADNEWVTAIVDNSIRLIIAGESKPLPDDYAILNYNGYTYLPSRYVAEQLGGTVTWDQGTRTITIKEPPEKVVEKIVEVEVEKPVEKIVYVEDQSYRSLPAYGSKGDIYVTVQAINRVGVQGVTKVMVEVKNNSTSDEYSIEYFNAVLNADGKDYKTSDAPQDQYNTLFQDNIRTEKSLSGQIIFPVMSQGTKSFTLNLPVRNQETNAVSTIVIKFQATLAGD